MLGQPRVKVVSLLPSATEIVCAVGARELLAGVSHECDFPEDVRGLPVLTRTKVLPSRSSRAIDRSVREVVRDALAVYDVDVELLRAIDPDVVVTQDLCDVCAVSLADVKSAVAALTRDDVTVVSLSPLRLGDVLADVRKVGEALGRTAEGERAAAAMQQRIDAVAARASEAAAAAAKDKKPAVLTIEWIDPVMPGGTWMPELIALAGGTPLVTEPGQKSPALAREQLEALDPDVVVVKPCGFDLERALDELDELPRVLPWNRWRAAREGRVYVADGNAYFNRSGPRLADSLEILAVCVHPAAFPDFARAYRGSAVRLTRDLDVAPLGG